LHDVLAMIVWVVHCDRNAWQNADESAQSVGFVFAFYYQPKFVSCDVSFYYVCAYVWNQAPDVCCVSENMPSHF